MIVEETGDGVRILLGAEEADDLRVALLMTVGSAEPKDFPLPVDALARLRHDLDEIVRRWVVGEGRQCVKMREAPAPTNRDRGVI